MKKKDGIDRCFGVARRSRARGDARNDAFGRMDGWMSYPQRDGTGRDGTGRRREDANDRLTMRARGDADGAILLLRRERGFHAQR